MAPNQYKLGTSRRAKIMKRGNDDRDVCKEAVSAMHQIDVTHTTEEEGMNLVFHR